MEYGIVGLLVLVADVYAIINIISSRVSIGAKLLWTLLVLILPVIGFVIWFFAGPRGKTSTI
ncbi:PLDc N-terminal domain-containing protein [Sulfitobacter sp. F26204]|uniref:PLDc N-terminal domain-containing protein n=1 Tax=Sulfitobacter sp. F26204 TaxID=2996014 RepID=UPI00225E23F5|nr:PLDc N-terminal domain-containing protein [Sulfitobacter sp. F26204]MCX7559269.1 PLDc N-terminal domain-containing protein [Sulfitobacter sp. F26204]